MVLQREAEIKKHHVCKKNIMQQNVAIVSLFTTIPNQKTEQSGKYVVFQTTTGSH